MDKQKEDYRVLATIALDESRETRTLLIHVQG